MTDVFYLPVPCMHCNNAPCVKAAQGNGITKRPDGIVLIDPLKAEGKKELVGACPYGAIWWNEETNVPQKCTFCAHLIDDKWKAPRCAQACPTGALQAICVEDEEFRDVVEKQHLQVYQPDFNTGPSTYYKNLNYFTQAFIAGSVAKRMNGISDCVEGACVTLIRNSGIVAELNTDNYGDFKFDGLDENSGKYVLTIKAADFREKHIEVDLSESIYLGDIYLE